MAMMAINSRHVSRRNNPNGGKAKYSNQSRLLPEPLSAYRGGVEGDNEALCPGADSSSTRGGLGAIARSQYRADINA